MELFDERLRCLDYLNTDEIIEILEDNKDLKE
jgi:hypothetical protein